MNSDLRDLISGLKEREAIQCAQDLLKAGTEPLDILEQAKNAMQMVGKKFEQGSAYIPDLVYAGEIMKQVVELIKPKLTHGSKEKHLGKVVMGSVEGDMHEIGKNLVCFMLEVNGFEVFDLGMDVKPEIFVRKIKNFDAHVIGLSGLLTSVIQSMKVTVDAIEHAGIRDRIKIMVGGSIVNERVREYCNADAYGPDAMAAVALAKKWTGGKK